ncbi:MAG: ABC transporter permease [Christensenellales bacterium]|jgi:ribose transport system permease protein
MKTVTKHLKQLYMNNGAFVYLICLMVIAAIFVPQFLSISNFEGLLKQWAVPAIICVGMCFILITGGIDLSMGYVCAFAAMLTGVLLKFYGLNPYLGILIGIIAGMLFGLFNGVVICYLRVPPFVATLGSGYIAYGLAQIVSAARSINRLPAEFMEFGTARVIGSLPVMVFIAVAIVIIGYILMNRTTYGRNLKYIGYNEQASRISGVKIGRIKCITYICSGMLAGIAGLFLTMRTGAAAPTLGGSAMPFEAVTACVIGGALLSGGFSPIIGSALGVLILKVIENCINLLNLSTYIYDAVLSIVVFIAIIVESLKKRRLSLY